MPIGWDAAAALSQYLNLGAQPSASLGTLLTVLAESVQQAVEAQLGRTLATQTYYEAYDGNDKPYLYLRHDPIQTLSSVTLNNVPLTLQDPAADPVYPSPQVCLTSTRDSIYRADGWVFSSGYRNILVQYEAGLTEANGDVPAALQMAVVYWAGALFRDRDRLGLSSQTMTGQMTGFTREVPDFVHQLIQPFKRPLFAVT